jgi:hypothetical protein
MKNEITSLNIYMNNANLETLSFEDGQAIDGGNKIGDAIVAIGAWCIAVGEVLAWL